MSAVLSSPILIQYALCLASAVFYVSGTAAMKLYGDLPFGLLMVPVGAAFILAAWFEVAVLRTARVGQVFLLIFAFEVTLTSLLAFVVLNERYSTRELIGLATIIAGIALMVPGRGADFALREATAVAAVPPAAANTEFPASTDSPFHGQDYIPPSQGETAWPRT